MLQYNGCKALRTHADKRYISVKFILFIFNLLLSCRILSRSCFCCYQALSKREECSVLAFNLGPPPPPRHVIFIFFMSQCMMGHLKKAWPRAVSIKVYFGHRRIRQLIACPANMFCCCSSILEHDLCILC